MSVSLFDGRVPCFKWARTRRKSGHSDCVDSQANLLVKGRRAEPDTMIVFADTTDDGLFDTLYECAYLAIRL